MYNGYQQNNPLAGMSRVDMLLALYDRAIAALEEASVARTAGDEKKRKLHDFQAQKLLFGIHAGLDTRDETAFNVARLLHFVVTRLEQADYQTARKILGELRNSFAAISDDARQLEADGVIPKLALNGEFEISV
jgi:flagellin-specific chaperone FliS